VSSDADGWLLARDRQEEGAKAGKDQRTPRGLSRVSSARAGRGDDMAVNIPSLRKICREPQTTFGMDTSDYP